MVFSFASDYGLFTGVTLFSGQNVAEMIFYAG
jgi:hypothetical protein